MSRLPDVPDYAWNEYSADLFREETEKTIGGLDFLGEAQKLIDGIGKSQPSAWGTADEMAAAQTAAQAQARPNEPAAFSPLFDQPGAQQQPTPAPVVEPWQRNAESETGVTPLDLGASNEWARGNVPGYAGAADVAGLIDRPRNAVESGFLEGMKQPGLSYDDIQRLEAGLTTPQWEAVTKAAGEGLRGERSTQGTDILAQAGMPEGNLRRGLGFGLDVAADLTNLVPVAGPTKAAARVAWKAGALDLDKVLLEGAQRSPILAELKRARDVGEIDAESARLGAYFHQVNPTADADTVLRISRDVHEVSRDVALSAGYQIEPGSVAIATGRTQTRRGAALVGPKGEELVADVGQTQIDLWRGADKSTLVEEWYHRFFDRLPTGEREKLAAVYRASGDKRPINEWFAQQGMEWFLNNRPYGGLLERTVAKGGQALRSVVERARGQGAQIDPALEGMFKKAGTTVEGATVTGAPSRPLQTPFPTAAPPAGGAAYGRTTPSPIILPQDYKPGKMPSESPWTSGYAIREEPAEQEFRINGQRWTAPKIHVVSVPGARLAQVPDFPARTNLATPEEAFAYNSAAERSADYQWMYQQAFNKREVLGQEIDQVIRSWDKAVNLKQPGFTTTYWQAVPAASKPGETGKIAGLKIVDLTQGCQRGSITIERRVLGLLPAETRTTGCYNDCWIDATGPVRIYGQQADVLGRPLSIVDPDMLPRWLAEPKIQRWLADAPFIRMGQRGDDSHALAFNPSGQPGDSLALRWFQLMDQYKIVRPDQDGVIKPQKTVMISASYAPVTEAQYAALLPYKDLFEIHFSNSGWFHPNEIMIRLGEFFKAREMGINARMRVITNADAIDQKAFPNDAWLHNLLVERGVRHNEILETPYHNDTTKQHSVASGRYKYVCCETGFCATCALKCYATRPGPFNGDQTPLAPIGDGIGPVDVSYQIHAFDPEAPVDNRSARDSTVSRLGVVGARAGSGTDESYQIRSQPGAQPLGEPDLDTFERLNLRYTNVSDRLQELETELYELDARRGGMADMYDTIELPPVNSGLTDDPYAWARGMSRGELLEFAQRMGRNPSDPGWYADVDVDLLHDMKETWSAGQTRGAIRGQARDTIANDADSARRRQLLEEQRLLRGESKILESNMQAALEGRPVVEAPSSAAEAAAQASGRNLPPTQPPLEGVNMDPLPEKEGFAGNIRLEKYPEGVREQVAAYAAAHPEQVQAARRGVRSDERVQQDAKALVEETGGDWKKRLKNWGPGQAWNAEEIAALRGVLRQKTEEVLAAQKRVRDTGDSPVELLRLRYALEEQRAVQDAVHGVTAEAGRALRAFRATVDEALGSRNTAKIERILRELGGKENTQRIAEALAHIDVDDPVAVNNFIRNVTKPNLQDYLTELFYNSILSGPKTHLVNAISNATTTMLGPIERAAAAGVDTALSRVQGRERTRYFGEAGAEVAGLRLGLQEATRAFAYTMKNGFTPEAGMKYEFRPKAFTGKVGRVINLPTTLLEASDQFFSLLNQRAALHAEALRLAKGNAEDAAALLANPTPELLERAGHIAEYRVFKQDSDAANKISNVRNITVRLGTDPNTRWAVQPLRFVIPFVQTPTNLLKYGLERSPLGFLNPQLWVNVAKGSPEAADQIARAGLGSLVAGGVALYAADGKITGAAPTNPGERDRFYRSGKVPYAIQVGDRWISYQRMEPLNQSLSQIAAAVEAIKANDKTADQKALQAATTVGANLLSQTFMTGLNDVVQAITQPERYGSQWAERFAGSIAVPFSSATRTVAQAGDPYIRRPEGIAETIQANVPGMSQNVPARLDAFGQPIEREARGLSPYATGRQTTDPVEVELGRLGYNLGFVGDSISNVKLSREDKDQYQRLSGNLTQQLFGRVVERDSYRRATDSQKVEILDKLAAEARALAREQVLQGMIQKRLSERGVR